MFCPFCGKEIGEEFVFCPSCGRRLPNRAHDAHRNSGNPQVVVTENATTESMQQEKRPLWQRLLGGRRPSIGISLLMITAGLIICGIGYALIGDSTIQQWSSMRDSEYAKAYGHVGMTSGQWIVAIIGAITNILGIVMACIGIVAILDRVRPANRQNSIMAKIVAILLCVAVFVAVTIMLTLMGIKGPMSIWDYLILCAICRAIWVGIVGPKTLSNAHSYSAKNIRSYHQEKELQEQGIPTTVPGSAVPNNVSVASDTNVESIERTITRSPNESEWTLRIISIFFITIILITIILVLVVFVVHSLSEGGKSTPTDTVYAPKLRHENDNCETTTSSKEDPFEAYKRMMEKRSNDTSRDIKIFSQMSDEELEKIANGRGTHVDFSRMSDEELEHIANDGIGNGVKVSKYSDGTTTSESNGTGNNVLDTEAVKRKVETEHRGKMESRDHLIPRARVVATIDGHEVPGAKLTVGKDIHTTPINWKFEDGKTYGPYKISYENNNKRYFGTFAEVTADWKGLKTFTIALNEYVRPKTVAHGKIQLWKSGPYWAAMNIGAEKPWKDGYHFWWGDTIGYRHNGNAWVAIDGSKSVHTFTEANTPTYNKSIAVLQREGWVTANGSLAMEHDAAHVLWGDGWRMPTKEELDCLVHECDWIWTTTNGVKGYIVRGRRAYASASIFLPVTGYWSSVPSSGYGHGSYAWGLDFHLSRRTNYGNRSSGRSVRPVQGSTNETDFVIEDNMRRETLMRLTTSEISTARNAMDKSNWDTAYKNYRLAYAHMEECTDAETEEYRKECVTGMAEAQYQAAKQALRNGDLAAAKMLANEAQRLRHPRAAALIDAINSMNIR